MCAVACKIGLMRAVLRYTPNHMPGVWKVRCSCDVAGRASLFLHKAQFWLELAILVGCSVWESGS